MYPIDDKSIWVAEIPSNNALLYYTGLIDADVPVEMHLYAEGGRAFGLRQTKYPITA